MRISKGFLWIFVLLLCGCCSGAKDEQISKKNLEESLENRVLLAKQVIQIYPNEAFGAGIRQQVESVVGKDVTEEARAKFRKLISPEEFTQKREEFLVKTFTVKELQALAALLSSAEGQALYEKLPKHNERWKEYLTPLLTSVLSNG